MQIDWSSYIKQLVIWLLVVTCMKITMGVLMVTFHVSLLVCADLVYGSFGSPTVKLVLVMIVTPRVMNTFQFWMVDNIIRKRDVEQMYEPVEGMNREFTASGRELSHPGT